jgi:hypothetical protein
MTDKHILETQIILSYTKYVDDILIMSDDTITDSDTLNNIINNTHSSLTFTSTPESNQQIPYLDSLHQLKWTHTENQVQPTQLSIIIRHPTEHKMAAYRFLLHTLQSLPLSNTRRQKEWNIIKQIVKSISIRMTLIL